jgi:hypothetical protein
MVSRRVGPTLIMDSFAPVNLEMYLTYFFAAGGSCENFRAECVDLFQPHTSSYTGSQLASWTASDGGTFKSFPFNR